MPENDLLTPPVERKSTWPALTGMIALLMTSVWLVSQGSPWQLLDSIELHYFSILASVYSVYSSGLALLKLSSGSVGGFIKKYGLKRSLSYIVFITVLAYLTVLLMDKSVLKAGEVIKDTIVERLDNSIVEIKEKRGPIKQRHLTGDVPYSIEEHTKYEGEDVVFRCYRLVSFQASDNIYPWADQVVWEKDGKVVKPSDHVNMTWSFEVVNITVDDPDDLKHYLISAKLTIIFLERQDFANYSCYVKNWVRVVRKQVIRLPKPKPPMCPLEPPPPCICLVICYLPDLPPPVLRIPPPTPQLRIAAESTSWKDDFNLVKVFSIVKMQVETRLVRAPPGGLVSFSATYDNIGDIDDISFDYTIGKEPFDNICGGPLNGCSKSVFIYWYFLHKGGHYYYFAQYFENVRMISAISGTGWQCVCKKSYDYHQFWFYRTIYNKTSERNEIREVRYPLTIRLAPRSPDLLYNFTNKVDPLAKEPCYQPTYSCRQDEESVEWMIWFILYLENCFFLVVALIVLVLIVPMAKLFKKMVLIPVRNKILEGSFRGCKDCSEKTGTLGSIKTHVDDVTIKHDVFISHAHNETNAGRQLKAVLEILELKAFLPEDDILGGQLKLEALSDAIASSRLFIVILTQEYIESGMKNRFEFHLILKKALKKTADYKNLLILRRDDSGIPSPLEQVCLLDWRENTNLEDKLRCLKKWSEGNVQGGNICAC